MSDARDVRVEHPMDAVIAALQVLRADAGAPSYAVITQRIVRARKDAGLSESAAYLGRSTVYDAFQPGRRRINVDLLGEIVLALGGTEAQAADWRARCVRARSDVRVSTTAQEVIEENAQERPAYSVARGRAQFLSLPGFLAACALLNLVGGWLVMVMRLPLYLDMVGTAISAVVLGPWWAALVAVGTNGGETVYDGRASLAFMVVNVVGALVWGYGVRKTPLGRGVAGFFALNALVALVCTAVSVPILLLVFHGVTRNAASGETMSLATTFHSLVAGLWSSNTVTSLVDKLLSGFRALAVASSLPASLRTRLPATWDNVGSGGPSAKRQRLSSAENPVATTA